MSCFSRTSKAIQNKFASNKNFLPSAIGTSPPYKYFISKCKGPTAMPPDPLHFTLIVISTYVREYFYHNAYIIKAIKTRFIRYKATLTKQSAKINLLVCAAIFPVQNEKCATEIQLKNGVSGFNLTALLLSSVILSICFIHILPNLSAYLQLRLGSNIYYIMKVPVYVSNFDILLGYTELHSSTNILFKYHIFDQYQYVCWAKV